MRRCAIPLVDAIEKDFLVYVRSSALLLAEAALFVIGQIGY